MYNGQYGVITKSKGERDMSILAKKLVISAYTLSSSNIGPRWGVIEIDGAFMDKLEKYSLLVRENDLLSVNCESDCDWDESDSPISDSSLVVGGDVFWFIGHPKHHDYSVETIACSISGLRKALETGEKEIDDPIVMRKIGDNIFVSLRAGADVHYLADRYTEVTEEEEAIA